MTEDVIIEAPKQVFYIKLTSEADMPTAFDWAYQQDTKREVLVPSEVVWSYDMTDVEYQAYSTAHAAWFASDSDDDEPHAGDFVTVPEGVIVNSSGPNDSGTMTLKQVTPAEYGENMIPDGDPYLVAYTSDYSIDVIGVMHEPTGNMLTDDDGNEYPEMAAVDGWHVNVKINRAIPNKDAEDPEAVDTLRDIIEALDASNGVTPNSPSRGWL